MNTSGFLKLASLLLVTGATTAVVAQKMECTYFPAPCPRESQIKRSLETERRTKDNVTLPQELTFEEKMRDKLTAEVQRIAATHGWEAYELGEETHDGPPYIFISYADWEATPYGKRPPHSYELFYVIVVNKDSLAKWRNWYTTEKIAMYKNVEDANVAAMKTQGDDPVLKSYMDSAMYYSQLSVKYTQDHNAEYVKAVQAGNEAWLKSFNNVSEAYHKKSEAYIAKAQARQNGNFATAAKSQDAANREDHLKTALFSGGSVVLVKFYLNPYLAEPGLELGSQVAILPQEMLQVPGATYAGLIHHQGGEADVNYDFQKLRGLYNNPAAIAFILLGKFRPKDGYNNFRSMFSYGQVSKATTIGSEKSIPCDALQTMSIHIEGRRDKVLAVLHTLDTKMLEAQIRN